MTGRERCDEILRLIDQALAESEMTAVVPTKLSPPGGQPAPGADGRDGPRLSVLTAL